MAQSADSSTTTTTVEEGASIGGTLLNNDRGVSGVDVTVRRHGKVIGTDTTAKDGTWRVPVPSAGTYQVALKTSSLPHGVTLRDKKRQSLDDVVVLDGQRKTVLFPLGPGISNSENPVSRLINLTVTGLKFGVILALASVGLSLIYGVTGLVNFAHGELVAFGAIVAMGLNTAGGGPMWPLIPSALLALVAAGLFGAGLEKGLWRPLRHRRTGSLALLVVSIGLSLLIRHLYVVVIGAAPRPYGQFTVQRAVSVGPVHLAPKEFAVIGLAFLVLIGVGISLKRTRLGTATRAVAANKDLAESSGIDVERVILVTWIIGSMLASLGGIFYGLTETVKWDMGLTLLLPMFAAVVLGGLGTAYGAMVGGLVLGVASEVSTFWLPVEFKTVVALAILIVVLLFRPQGILGVRERVG